MLLCSGAVYEGRSFCPLCRAPTTHYTEAQPSSAQPASAPPLNESGGGIVAARDVQAANLAAPATPPDVEMQEAVTTTVAPDILTLIRQNSGASARDQQHTFALLRQLTELRLSPQRQQQQEAQNQQHIWRQHLAQHD